MSKTTGSLLRLSIGVSSKSFLRAISASITCLHTEQLNGIAIFNLTRAALPIYSHTFVIQGILHRPGLQTKHDSTNSLMQACSHQHSKRKCSPHPSLYCPCHLRTLTAPSGLLSTCDR